MQEPVNMPLTVISPSEPGSRLFVSLWSFIVLLVALNKALKGLFCDKKQNTKPHSGTVEHCPNILHGAGEQWSRHTNLELVQ